MTPEEMLQEIDEHGEGLTPWEIGFIADMLERRSFTPKQVDAIERILDLRVPEAWQ